VIVLGLVFVVAGLWLRRRAKRKAVLAGITEARPTFTLPPPRRFNSRLKDHHL
jgi:hypothetical protein